MALYELYQGGDRTPNADYAMLPAAPFSLDFPYQAAQGQQHMLFGPERVYDFTGKDEALRYFVETTLKSTPLVSGDVLGTAVVPAYSLFLGFQWRVYSALTGGAFSVSLRNAAVTYLAAQTTGTASSGFVPITGAADWLPMYMTAPDILDVTLDTVPADGIKGLVLSITPVYIYFRAPYPFPQL